MKQIIIIFIVSFIFITLLPLAAAADPPAPALTSLTLALFPESGTPPEDAAAGATGVTPIPDPANPDASGWQLSMKTGEVMLVSVTATISNTVPGNLYTVTLDPRTLPNIGGEAIPIQYTITGSTPTQEFCDIRAAAETTTCTFTLRVALLPIDNSEIYDPHDPPLGHPPGTYTGVLSASLQQGNSLSTPVSLKVSSGALAIRFDNVYRPALPNENVPGTRVDVMRRNAAAVLIQVAGFPKDSALPSTAELAIEGAPPGLTVTLTKTTCLKSDLQVSDFNQGCSSGARFAADKTAPLGEHTLSFKVNKKEEAKITVFIGSRGIEVVAINPFEREEKELKGVCRVKVFRDDIVTMTGAKVTDDFTPTIKLTYNWHNLFTYVPNFFDEYPFNIKKLKETATETVKAKPVPGEPDLYEAQLPFILPATGPLDVKLVDTACNAELTVMGRTFKAIDFKQLYSQNFLYRVPLEPLESGAIGLTCGTRGKEWLPFPQRVTLYVKDKKGNLYNGKDGKPLTVTKIAGDDSRVEFSLNAPSDINSLLQPGDLVVCEAVTEVYPPGVLEKLKEGEEPSAAPLLHLSSIDYEYFQQGCVPVTYGGFGKAAKETLTFLTVVPPDDFSANDNVGSLVYAFEENKIFRPYRSLFTLRKTKVAYPAKPRNMAETFAAGKYLDNVCTPPSKYTIIPVFSWGIDDKKQNGFVLITGKGTAAERRYLVVAANELFTIIARHELGHLFGDLDDEYIPGVSGPPSVDTSNVWLFGKDNCNAGTTAIVDVNGISKKVCNDPGELTNPVNEWKKYPDTIACVPGCGAPIRFRATEESIMCTACTKDKDGEPIYSNQFNIPQCAHLTQRLDAIKGSAGDDDTKSPRTFSQAMQYCYDNRVNLRLVTQPAQTVHTN